MSEEGKAGRADDGEFAKCFSMVGDVDDARGWWDNMDSVY